VLATLADQLWLECSMPNSVGESRFVAYFDMLGFKEAIRADLDEAWGALGDLRVSMEDALHLFSETTHSTIIIPNSVRTQATNFSDSVLIFSYGDTSQDLHTILIESAHLFAKALKRCVPLRGGISLGHFRFNFDKWLFCGPALVRAYEMGEEAVWSGIVVDDAVADKYRQDPIRSHNRSAIRRWALRVRKKNGRTATEDRWVLDWPLVYAESFTGAPPISVGDYSKPFDRLFHSSYPAWPKHIQEIYDNTVAFVNDGLSTLAREHTPPR
jgi:hypothetical protein